MTIFRNKTDKTRLLLSAGALFAVTIFLAPSAYAQSNSQTLSRLDQIENQIQTLSRAVYRGDKLPADMAPSDNTAALSTFEGRISDIENRQREMTGQIERIGHDVQQMKDRLDRALADIDQRLADQQGAAAQVQPSATSASASGGGSAVVTPPQPAAAGGSAADMSAAPTTTGTLGSMPATPGTAGADGATSLYESAFADIRDSKFESAEKKFKQFMSQYPQHKLASNAQYWLSETHYVRGDFPGAARMFAQGYQDYPDGPKAADSLLKLGLSLAKLGKKEDACLSFQQLKKQFPNDTTVGTRATQQIKALACAS